MSREGHARAVARLSGRPGRGVAATAALLVLVVLVVGTGGAGSTAVAAPAIGTTPNDPAFPLQWNLQAVGAPAAWAAGTGAGTTIAIVDSGIDLGHDDLRTKIAGHVTCLDTGGDPGRCTAGGASDGQDDNGHGTHTAGIAAATTDNGIGVAGVAPGASLLSVKVLRQTCDSVSGCDATGNADDVAAGIEYASSHGATVINLSLGSTVDRVLGPAFAQAIDDAWQRGVIAVVAAGNDFVLPSGFGDQPAIVVGALDRNGGKASYDNPIGGARWALMAPGGEADSQSSCAQDPQGVLSTYLGNRLACLAGTSMAAPHVAGAAAILRGMGYTPQETVDRLLATARRIGPASVYGSGALDVAAAASGPPPAAASAGPPPTQSAGSGAAIGTQSEAPSTPAGGVQPGTTAPPGDPGDGPSTTGPAAVLDLRQSTGTAAAATRRAGGGDAMPAGPVAVAVLLAAGVAIACSWVLMRNASWARRTADRRATSGQTRSLSNASR